MDVQPNASAITPSNQAGLVEYLHWVYALYALSVISGLLTTRTVALRFAFGLPSLIAIIMDYVRRSEARGTWLETHFRWQIRTFWYALLWVVVIAIVAAPLVLLLGLGLLLGLIGFGLVGIWVIYRIARGWLTLREARPMPLTMQ
jgi:uncharacterized membrane protein